MAFKIRKACRNQCFTPAELLELNELQRTLVHPRDRARSAQLLEEAQKPPHPMEGFADEAENRLDQDLLLLASGNRTKNLQRRLKRYQNFIADADAANGIRTEVQGANLACCCHALSKFWRAFVVPNCEMLALAC